MAKKSVSSTFDPTTALNLIREIAKTTEVLESLKKKLILALPAQYGSKLWWEKEHLLAREDIKAGRTYTLKSPDDLDKPFEEMFPNAR